MMPKHSPKVTGRIWEKDKIFFYAGTLNRTLDFEAIQFTAEKFAKINKNVKFVICGDGPEINIFMKKLIMTV